MFATAFDATGAHRQSLNDLVEELVDWRLADYLGSDPAQAEVGVAEVAATPFEHAQPSATQGASLWREYMREEIPGLYGLKFSTGSWNQGFVVQGKQVFLLVTLKKDDLQEAHRYEDRFVGAGRFHWQSQNRTTQASTHGQIISGQLPGYTLHLFVRTDKKRGLKAAPFVYCGEVQFESWEGEKPIAVYGRLAEPVPVRLHRTFQITD